MTDSLDPASLSDPRDAAAYWFGRVRSERMDEAERQRFEAWRRADPSHDLEYRRACGIWNGFALVDADRLRALATEPAPTSPARRATRRPLLAGLGLACAVAAAVGVTWPQWRGGPAGFTAAYATQAGQREQATLPDASILDLNTATRLTVHLYDDRRVIVLDAGEATFSVTPDPGRPFYVEAGPAVVRVTGTRFNVRRTGDAVDVAVESGAVEVRAGHWWNRSQVLLGGGQGARALADGELSPPRAVDVSSLLAWHAGRLVLRDQALADAVSELNRHGGKAIRIANADLGRLRISGVFSVDKPQAFLELLPAIAPVRVRVDADGGATIVGR